MSETFKPIETQEAFDAAIAERLERDRKKYAGQVEADLKGKGWKSPEEVEQLTADLSKQIKTLQDTAAETARTIADKDKEIQFTAFAQSQNQPAPIGNPGGKAQNTASPWASVNSQLSE